MVRKLQSYFGILTEIVEEMQVGPIAILEGGVIAVTGVLILRSLEEGWESLNSASEAICPICVSEFGFPERKTTSNKTRATHVHGKLSPYRCDDNTVAKLVLRYSFAPVSTITPIAAKCLRMRAGRDTVNT